MKPASLFADFDQAYLRMSMKKYQIIMWDGKFDDFSPIKKYPNWLLVKF